MASTCFCGCGRTVRFSRKRLSDQGAAAAATVATLREIDVAIRQRDRVADRQVRELIGQGEQVLEIYAGLVHGGRSGQSGTQLRMHILDEWDRVAIPLVAKHGETLAPDGDDDQLFGSIHPEAARLAAAVDAAMHLEPRAADRSRARRSGSRRNSATRR